MKRIDLDYRTEECTGEWQRELHGSFVHWRCSECHKLDYGAPDVRAAAARENALGKVLNLLAGMGQRKKDAGEELPEGWDR